MRNLIIKNFETSLFIFVKKLKQDVLGIWVQNIRTYRSEDAFVHNHITKNP